MLLRELKLLIEIKLATKINNKQILRLGFEAIYLLAEFRLIAVI